MQTLLHEPVLRVNRTSVPDVFAPVFLSTSSATLTTWQNSADQACTSSAAEPCNGTVRWYDPITGRWLSNDPIGISGGLNQYVFCANNPLNVRDPLGLNPGDVYFFASAIGAEGHSGGQVIVGAITPGGPAGRRPSPS